MLNNSRLLSFMVVAVAVTSACSNGEGEKEDKSKSIDSNHHAADGRNSEIKNDSFEPPRNSSSDSGAAISDLENIVTTETVEIETQEGNCEAGLVEIDEECFTLPPEKISINVPRDLIIKLGEVASKHASVVAIDSDGEEKDFYLVKGNIVHNKPAGYQIPYCAFTIDLLIASAEEKVRLGSFGANYRDYLLPGGLSMNGWRGGFGYSNHSRTDENENLYSSESFYHVSYSLTKELFGNNNQYRLNANDNSGEQANLTWFECYSENFISSELIRSLIADFETVNDEI